MPDMDMNLSRVESILEDTLGYDGVNVEQPKSRVEQLLIELREAIEAGGGGGSGGTTNYNALVNKPQISGVTLQGDLSLTDIGVINYDDTEIRGLVANKVDKVAGKQLSSEDYTLEEKTKLASLSNYDDTEVRSLIANKVDKVAGKQLSSEDYTLEEKTKLASLSNYDDTEIRGLVANKVDKVAGKQLSSEDYTLEEKTKLASLSNYDDTEIRSLISTKQNTLTFDGAPAESSTNPVTSGGVYTSQQAQDSVIAFATNAGAKNLLNVTGTSVQTVTVNADGTMTVNGTNSSNVSITLGTVALKAGRYILSSGVNLPQGVYLSVRVAAGETKHDCTHNIESVEFTVPTDMTMDRVWLFIPANTTIENLTVRPMIRHAEITDDTFVSYAPTNRELYEMFNAISQSEYDALITKTLPLYFVYEDDATTQNSNAASLMSASPLMTNSAGSDIGGVDEATTESDFSFKSDEGTDSTFDFFSEEES